jgi:hypothetical protein
MIIYMAETIFVFRFQSSQKAFAVRSSSMVTAVEELKTNIASASTN